MKDFLNAGAHVNQVDYYTNRKSTRRGINEHVKHQGLYPGVNVDLGLDLVWLP